MQPPLQNSIFDDEEEAERLKNSVDINFLRDKEGLIHLTQEEYEDFKSYTQNNEDIPDHSMILVDHQSRYNLRSKNIDDNPKLLHSPRRIRMQLKFHHKSKWMNQADLLHLR